MAAIIKPCKCEHEFQDRKYGRNQRVHNTCNKGARCSVCGDTKDGGGYVGKKGK